MEVKLFAIYFIDVCCIYLNIKHHNLLYYLVTVDVKSRVVTVKGPKGQLQREFKHLALDFSKIDNGKKLKCDLWFGNRETIACIR